MHVGDSKNPTTTTRVSPVGLTSIIIGVALANLGPMVFDGFVKGLFVGGGVTLVVIGVLLVSSRWRARPDRSWLPSRDESHRDESRRGDQ